MEAVACGTDTVSELHSPQLRLRGTTPAGFASEGRTRREIWLLQRLLACHQFDAHAVTI